jgi:hypothetical protein
MHESETTSLLNLKIKAKLKPQTWARGMDSIDLVINLKNKAELNPPTVKLIKLIFEQEMKLGWCTSYLSLKVKPTWLLNLIIIYIYVY